MKPIKPLYVIIVVIIVAAAGLYGGMQYQKSQTRAGFARFGGGAGAGGRFGQGGPGGPGGANGMTPVRGQVVSQANGSVTIKLIDGSSKIVDITSKTSISKTTTGSVSDLKSGETVTAIGTTNSDGSVTAQTVLVGNGNMMFRRPGGGR